MTVLKTLLGDHAVTAALKRGDVVSPTLRFDFADVKVPNTAFKRVVRDLEFDVAELAIVTYLMAKAQGVPLTLLPTVLVARFQQPYLVCNAERAVLSPADLHGRRVGIRSHTVTTAMWVRGVLADDFGVDLDRIRWVTFEDAHVAGFPDPSGFERAPVGSDMAALLISGELDAAIIPGLNKDSRFVPVIPNPDQAAQDWHRKYSAIQLNHLVAVRSSLCREEPEKVREIYRVLCASKQRAPVCEGEMDFNPFGIETNRRNLEVAIDYTYRQGLIPSPTPVDMLFKDLPPEI